MNKLSQIYPSDLTDAQWHTVRRLLARRCHSKRGRPRDWERTRALLNAIFYLLRTGCQWRYLPKDYPPWGTVASQYSRWRADGTWDHIHNALHAKVRQQHGKKARPSAAILDSQSVKTTEVGGPKGFDSGKKVKGRKRHLVVDTLGLLLAVVVTPANVQDYHGARQVLRKVKERYPRTIRKIWADSIYALGGLPQWCWLIGNWVLEIVAHAVKPKRFEVLPWRWVVERTFAWWGRYRRLSKDYERDPHSSETMIKISMIHLMLRRLKPPENLCPD